MMRLFLACALAALPLAAADLGQEIEVTEAAAPLAAQRGVFVSHDSSRTLVAFEEEGRLVLHQYEARTGKILGRETFEVGRPGTRKRGARIFQSMIVWVEADPQDPQREFLWSQQMGDFRVGSNFRPVGQPERIAEVKAGTDIAIFKPGVLYLIAFTAPDGALYGVHRQLQTLVGFDRRPFYLTWEQALNPALPRIYITDPTLVAYNHPEPSGKHSIKATTLSRNVRPGLDIAPEGASKPVVVTNRAEHVVLWSMENEQATYAQRVRLLSDGSMSKVGGVVRLYDGVLHDATLAPNGEYYVAVDEGWRFALLRVDSRMNVLATTPFRAQVTEGERISISGDNWMTPVLAYAAETYAAPRAVLRLVEERTAPAKRRSTR